MAFAEKRLAQVTPVAEETALTVSSGTVIITNIMMCNTTSSATNIKVYCVPNGKSADNTTAIYYDYEIPANMTYTKKLWLVLDTVGDSIVIDSIGITYTISGARVT
jgi:hypothetical protein